MVTVVVVVEDEEGHGVLREKMILEEFCNGGDVFRWLWYKEEETTIVIM